MGDSLVRQNIKSDTKMKGAKKLPVTTKVKCISCERMVDERLCCDREYCDVNEDIFKMGLMTEAKHKRLQDNVKVCRRLTKELREPELKCPSTDSLVRQNIKSVTKIKGAKKLPVTTKVK